MASSSSSSTESCCTCPWLLMDRLWFQRSVVQSISTTSSINTATEAATSSSFSSESNTSSSNSTIDCSDEVDLAQIFHVVHGSLPIITITPQDDPDEEEKSTMKLTKQAARKKTKLGSCNSRPRKLERTLSCKTLTELQQEEVKGFLDLGFIFSKDHLTPRMISVIPGLQSVEEHQNDVVKEEEEGAKKGSNRGYLSEAWMVKRPDSPILRLRMSRVSTTTGDMKKHLRLWAKAVASTSAAPHR